MPCGSPDAGVGEEAYGRMSGSRGIGGDINYLLAWPDIKKQARARSLLHFDSLTLAFEGG